MDTESNGANFRSFSESLHKRGLSFRVLKLHGLDASLVVQVSGILIVRDRLGEAGLYNKVTSLFIQVLLQVHANDDVHGRGLTDLVLVQAAVLVGFEDERTDLRQ